MRMSRNLKTPQLVTRPKVLTAETATVVAEAAEVAEVAEVVEVAAEAVLTNNNHRINLRERMRISRNLKTP